ncbi:hypothetical protein [Arsenophonus endosymbiont of Bemisia tabaci]|uniref:hypothetical protein n=1 Tax=Arsenophonus endosymbiont of Bemisia tabaci TaxID=536059 RepID=UPI0015F4A074|nr:hypothetical protein [Arsenophonus endosymbiont of Bemisia tabaci]CAA2929871.1 Putative glucose-6-phosphate 1-epimerase [Arsenophonus endosymbiont of Bemisia tabaci Q2]
MRSKLAATCEIEFEYYGTEPATGALHTYLEVSGINKIYIEGLGKPYIDKVAYRDVYTEDTKTYITPHELIVFILNPMIVIWCMIKIGNVF